MPGKNWALTILSVCQSVWACGPYVVYSSCGNRSRLSVCMSVCKHCHGWTIWHMEKKIRWRSAWTISWSSLIGKVIGQRSRSRGQKHDCQAFGLGLWCIAKQLMVWRHDVCYTCVYMCQFIVAKGLPRKMTVLEGNAGGYKNVTAFSFWIWSHHMNKRHQSLEYIIALQAIAWS